jgi:hypothetical protein
MHHQLSHGGRLGEVQITGYVVAVDGQQVFGAIVSELSQHLIADWRDGVGLFGRGDQVADPALLVAGQGNAPADRRH